MSTITQVSLAEYLGTVYEPDCDYVDGVVEERNVGMKRHSRTQTILSAWLFAREKHHGQRVLVEQRVQVSPSRVRIPDICLIAPDNDEEITQRPPVLWVEVLSPDDRWSRVQARLKDVLAFGVPTIWIIDPYSNEAWITTADGAVKAVQDGILRCAAPSLELPLKDILPEE